MLFEGSKPSKAFDIGIKHGVILFSSSTFAELEEILSRNKFNQYISHEERKQFLTNFILRNGDEITSPTMHHSFRPPLPDLKSQKYRNSLLFLQLL